VLCGLIRWMITVHEVQKSYSSCVKDSIIHGIANKQIDNILLSWLPTTIIHLFQSLAHLSIVVGIRMYRIQQTLTGKS
jgi:hypothetical protein